ncbi:type II toxin-antitoxin system VapC family toxin [Jiangella gansuensis]|uniref:type II toxin-antitoxin system VapC family toxin n=1 Tax=Jiangella gansuensis TaxID=281473 RepID=UPI00047DB969|nr:type II toxin-antitoxin system VapC family toxin [Jiangella gansuensis]
MIIYVDTSAAMKLVVEEDESAAAARHLETQRHDNTLVSSLLLHVELHRAASRRPEQVPRDVVADVLSTIDLVDIERSDLLTAAALPGGLRSGDAIHLAAALRLGADRVVAYDKELLSAASAAGLSVTSPV